MKTVKNTFLTLSTLALLSVGTTTNLLAEDSTSMSGVKNDGTFVIATWSPDTKSGTVSGHELKGNGMIGVSGGKKNLFSNNVGGYIGFDKSYNSVGEDGRSNEVMYAYTIFNAGLTFTPTESLTLMAGVGYSQESAEYADNGNYYVSIEDNDQMNYNFEASYKINEKYGLVVGYNTAPEAYNVGVEVRF